MVFWHFTLGLMVWQYLLLSCQGRDRKSGIWPKLHILKGKQFFLWVCCLLAKNYLILHPSFENLTTNIALNRICKFHILGSMPSDEWFRLVDIALDKITKDKFCTIKAGKVFYVVASFLLGIFIVFHLLIQNGPWSFTFLADIFQSKVHFEDALCN